MTTQILKLTGHIVYRGTYCGLTKDELHSPIHQQTWDEFDWFVATKLGNSPSPSDFDPTYITPDLDDHDDDADLDPDHSDQSDKEMTPASQNLF